MMLQPKSGWLQSADGMLGLGGIHQRLELSGFDRRGEVFGAEAMRFEFVDRIVGAIDHDGGGSRAERPGVRHQVQSVIRLQP
jgi:hypothetical protein